MKRLTIVGLCLVAAFALSAMVVSSAGAVTPTYKSCGKAAKVNKKYTGHYTTKVCSPSAVSGTNEGKYERGIYSAAKKLGIKGKLKGTAPHNNLVDPTCPKGDFNHTSNACEPADAGKATASEPADIAGTTTCQKEKVTGAVTSATNTEWQTEYSKCEAEESACNTTGSKAGDIKTEKLESTLVELNAAETEVGLHVVGKGPKGLLAQYECLGGVLQVHVYKSVLAKTTGNFEETGTGTTIASVKEGPLALQSNTYIGAEAAQTEEDAKAFFIWGEKFEACVKERVEKGEGTEEAEFLCETGEAGAPETGPPPATEPIMLSSETSFGTAPAVQNGETENKGSKEILIEN
jgi:hypothetical protein